MANVTETRLSLDQETREAVREGVRTVLGEQSSTTELHAFIDGERPLDRELWSQASSLGWLGFGIPEPFGGVGLGEHGLAILHAELGRHAAPGPFIATLSAAQAIGASGDDAALHAWLPRIAAGGLSVAVPVDLASGELTLSDGTVSGSLRCLGSPEAALVLAPATGDGWLLVECAGAGTRPLSLWDRTRTVIDLTFEQAQPLARLGDGATVRAALMRAMMLGVAADSAGAVRSIVERTIDYMKSREQFGRPIASFQALKHRVADLVTKVEVIDEVVLHAVERAADDEVDADLWAMLAKAEATEAFSAIATDCLQLHGGVGFTWDFDPHVFLKRARLNELLVAANPVLRDRAAASLAGITGAGRTALELAA